MFSDYIPPGQRSCLIIKFLFIKMCHSSARYELMLLFVLLTVCSSKRKNTEDRVVITDACFDYSRLLNIIYICSGNVIYDKSCTGGLPSCFLYYLGEPILIINSTEVFYMIRYIIVPIKCLIFE